MPSSCKSALVMMSNYHVWANRRIVDAVRAAVASSGGKKIYRNNDGSYFGSIKGTVSHIAGVDDLWYLRLTGGDPSSYNYFYSEGTPVTEWATLFNDFDTACKELIARSERFVEYVDKSNEDSLIEMVSFEDTKGEPVSQQRGAALFHVFNHGTHHRGQLHTALTSMEQGRLRRFAPELDLPLIGADQFKI